MAPAPSYSTTSLEPESSRASTNSATTSLMNSRESPSSSDRIAIATAGDDRLAVRTAMRLIDRLGFDAVDAGPLASGRLLEADGSPYATTYTAPELERRFAARQRA